MTRPSARIETALGIAVLSLLAVGCFVVLRPFLAAILWAVILAIATWPVFRWLERRLKGRRILAAALTTVLLAVVLLVPLLIVVTSLAENVTSLVTQLREVFKEGPPTPPPWLRRVPVLGGDLEQHWREWIRSDVFPGGELIGYLGPAKDWILATGAGLGGGILDLGLSVLTTFFIYRDGERGVKSLNAVLERLAGDRAQKLLALTEGTVRSVVYGIIGTALAQGILAGLGFWLMGVPGALFLGLITSFLSIIPFGPPLVWLPAALWLFYTGSLNGGVFLLLWGLLVISSVDNVLKPYFISRGSNLPLILVFIGVLGGVIAFGFLGVFLGPVLLALGYTLLHDWSQTDSVPSKPA
nr:AI-2E family transporter [Gammaproteobacteria bacterium]